MFEKHWEFVTGPISSMKGRSWKRESPEKIAQSQKARKIYLGDGFELGRRHPSKAEEKKEVNIPAQGRLMGMRWP